MVGGFAIITVIFVGLFLGVALARRKVSPQDIEARHAIAKQLSLRDWKEGDTTGAIVDGKLKDSNLPSVISPTPRIEETENYSDLFKTYTVFEFEVGNPSHRCSIQIGQNSFAVHR